jgi:DnaJ-class molecular chaperone
MKEEKEVRFNRFKNELIRLQEGEQFCKKCSGKGVVPNKNKIYYSSVFPKLKYLTCSECLGDGKIDWIEKITGKENGKRR